MKKLLLLSLLSIFIFSCDSDDSDDEINVIKTTISYLSPSENSEVYNNDQTELSVVVSENVEKVEYYIDGENIGSTISEPFSINWTPENISGGQHTLSAVAISREGEEIQVDLKVNFILRLGDSFRGGKIFFLDETNNHGLIASEEDLSVNSNTGFFWGRQDELIGADHIESGKENTSKIANSAPEDYYYAGYAFKNNYEHNGFDDWYIPSKNELIILKENKGYAGGFSNNSNSASYWSSTELTSDKAFALNFVALMGNDVSKGMYSYRIRPIRQF